MAKRETLVELGERIHAARQAAALKQGDLSLLIGVSQSTLSQWERGRGGRPDRQTVAGIEKACGAAPGSLEEGLDFDDPSRVRPMSFPVQLEELRAELDAVRQEVVRLSGLLEQLLPAPQQPPSPKRSPRPATPPAP